MDGPVKRAYHSPRRREQAAATRADILSAAQRLFEQHGYGSTTMAAIAAEAGVALKTVYLAFESKSGVLRALWNRVLRGDDENLPVAGREWYRAVLEEPDAERQLRLNAHNARVVKERAGAVLEIIRNASQADPVIAALWQRIQEEFFANQRAIIDSLAARAALRPGLGVDEAADLLWTLNHPALWALLVGERKWTPERFEAWLADTFCSQLLGVPPRATCQPSPRQRCALSAGRSCWSSSRCSRSRRSRALLLADRTGSPPLVPGTALDNDPFAYTPGRAGSSSSAPRAGTPTSSTPSRRAGRRPRRSGSRAAARPIEAAATTARRRSPTRSRRSSSSRARGGRRARPTAASRAPSGSRRSSPRPAATCSA